jgi:hydroxypyruvate reductase/glycerate 2-kinase
MIIKNRDALANTQLKKQVLDIIEAGINQVLPPNIMRSAVKYDAAIRKIMVGNDVYDITDSRIFVIGGGKASGLMAKAFEDIIGVDNITEGVVNCKGGKQETKKIKIIIAGHPIPDKRGVNGVNEMLALKHRYSIGEKDIIICLISGGGSSLLPYPAETVNLEDKQVITALLVGSGAEISEINVVRKHLSGIKGGQLGNFFSPATIISLILSDVIGNDLSVIASGPTFPDSSTFADAWDVLKRYDFINKAPKSVIEYLARGRRSDEEETPKKLGNCHNYIIGDNRLALEAMLNKAIDMGLAPYIITDRQKGDTGEVARLRAGEVLKKKYGEYNLFIIGGETTVTLPAGAGRGGRNQHYTAASLAAMAPYSGRWVVACVSTDGSDFLPDVAGAMVDHDSAGVARVNGLDVNSYLERYDSNTLLDRMGNALIITGDTGTNVADVILYRTV